MNAVLWMGHLELVFKGDNGGSLQAMIDRAMQLLRVRAAEGGSDAGLRRLTKETSAPYDSQSNGGTEVGVMLIRGIFRTLKLCLEGHLQKYIPVAHSIVPWLLEHSAFLLNVKVRGRDGLTAWSRVKGRPFGMQSIGFGESVFFKRPTKGPNAQPDGNMGAVQSEGVFVGYNRSTNTYILASEGGKFESRSVSRRPEQNRWSAERIGEITMTPWSTREKTEQVVRFEDAVDGEPPVEAAPVSAPRKFRINPADLATHGYTEKCAQCMHIETVGRARPGGTHSDACRKRIIEAIGQT